MAIMIAVIRNEAVSEIVPLRDRSLERSNVEKLVDISDPAYAHVKVGDPWPNRENRLRIEALKKASPDQRAALLKHHTDALGFAKAEFLSKVLELEQPTSELAS